MSIQIGDNFKYQGKKPLDGRILYSTVADMVAMPEASLYEGCTAYVTATGKEYRYKASNTVDSTLGKWRETEDYTTAEKTKLANLENIQVSAMPTASADNLGQIVQYIGSTTSTYTNGYFYECVEDSGSYSWVEKTVQEAIDNIQVEEMPEASADYIGKIYQYIGETSTYTKGYFYECVLVSSRTVTIFAPHTSSTSSEPRTYTEDNVVKGGTGNIYSDIECTNQYGTWDWTITATTYPRLIRGSGSWFGVIEEIRTINTYEWKAVSTSEVDFDDLTNRPLESDTIDISELDLPMPAKPTEYPVLFDETGTEYQVGWYKRASDGKVKPVWRKFVILASSVVVNTSWVNICQISDVERMVNKITYDFSGGQVQNVEFVRYSSGYVQAITISGAGHGVDAITVEYTKTTDEFRDL